MVESRCGSKGLRVWQMMLDFKKPNAYFDEQTASPSLLGSRSPTALKECEMDSRWWLAALSLSGFGGDAFADCRRRFASASWSTFGDVRPRLLGLREVSRICEDSAF